MITAVMAVEVEPPTPHPHETRQITFQWVKDRVQYYQITLHCDDLHLFCGRNRSTIQHADGVIKQTFIISDSPEQLSQGPLGLGAPCEGEFVFFYT